MRTPGLLLVLRDKLPMTERGLQAQVVRDGDELSLAALSVRVLGDSHAVVHPDIPTIPNANVG